MFSNLLIIVLLLNFIYAYRTEQNVHHLEQDDVFNFNSSKFSNRQLQIFCHQGKPKKLIHIWSSVILKIKHSTGNYNQFEGSTPEQVENDFTNSRYSWSWAPFSTESKLIKLNPFNSSCLGITSQDNYSIQLKTIKIDLWKPLKLIIGILLYLTAPTLSKNSFFHYTCGITFGVCASCLITIYFLSKIFPRKPFMYGMISIGWSVVIYFFRLFWDDIKMNMSIYQVYVVWYIVVTATISFILLYRWGPVKNPKTMNLIKWSLQLVGLSLIFMSSYFQEAAMCQVILVLLFTHIPKKWILSSKKYWKKKFPPKLKPLTNDQYYEEAVRETAKALTQLREFCASPECNQWNTALKLKDVKRFASFMEGNSHLLDEEIMDYETSINAELTEDEESNSNISQDEEIMDYETSINAELTEDEESNSNISQDEDY